MNRRQAVVMIWLAVGLTCLTDSSIVRADIDDPDDAEDSEISIADQSPCGWGKPCTTDELIAELDKLEPEVCGIEGSRAQRDAGMLFWELFERACRDSNREQLGKLTAMYRQLPVEAVQKIALLPALASRYIQRESQAIATEHRKVRIANVEIAVPTELGKASKALQGAWIQYRRALIAYEESFPKVDGSEKIDGGANAKTFFEVVTRALTDPTKEAESELRRFDQSWTGCLNDTSIADSKMMGLVSVLLRQRRLNEAIGGALHMTAADGGISSPEKTVGAVIELLKACGLDWETIFAGAQADMAISKHCVSWSKSTFLDALAARGTDRSAAIMNELSQLTDPDCRPAFLNAFNMWIETSPDAGKCKEKTVFVSPEERLNRTPISKMVQRACLTTTERLVSAECPVAVAEAALNIFGRTQSDSSIPALQSLTKHTSNRISEDASAILCAMGQMMEPAPVIGVVRFQVLVNGEPLPAGTDLTYEIQTRGGDESNRKPVSANGMLELEKKLFANPGRPVNQVKLSARGPAGRGLRFDAEVPAPTDLDALTTVNVEASPLRLKLHNLDRLNAPRPERGTVIISKHTIPIPERFWFRSGARETVPISAESIMVFPALECGTYDVWITLPGSDVWHGVVEVSGDGAPIDVRLKPGSDVRFEIVGPEGRSAFAQLIKDGKPVDAEPDHRDRHLYRALPCGNYVLHIAGNEPTKQIYGGRTFKPGPDEIGYAGRDIAFMIRDGSPALIDLGKIELGAAR